MYTKVVPDVVAGRASHVELDMELCAFSVVLPFGKLSTNEASQIARLHALCRRYFAWFNDVKDEALYMGDGVQTACFVGQNF
eukprot:5004393-Pleurochrysis_carterae.AAC.1